MKREGQFSMPDKDPQMEISLALLKKEFLSAIVDRDQEKFIDLIQDLNKKLMIKSGYPQFSEYPEELLNDVKKLVSKFFKEVESDWGSEAFPLADNAWTRLVVVYKNLGDIDFSLNINENNAKKKIFQLWKSLEKDQ